LRDVDVAAWPAARIAGSSRDAQVAMATALVKRFGLTVQAGPRVLAATSLTPLVEALWGGRSGSKSKDVQWAVDKAVVTGLSQGGTRSLRACRAAGYSLGRQRFRRARDIGAVAPGKGGRRSKVDSPTTIALVNKVRLERSGKV
jgi:hypothetical protein